MIWTSLITLPAMQRSCFMKAWGSKGPETVTVFFFSSNTMELILNRSKKRRRRKEKKNGLKFPSIPIYMNISIYSTNTNTNTTTDETTNGVHLLWSLHTVLFIFLAQQGHSRSTVMITVTTCPSSEFPV